MRSDWSFQIPLRMPLYPKLDMQEPIKIHKGNKTEESVSSK